jgi:hypothetical protein
MEESIVKSIDMNGEVTVLNPAVFTPPTITTPPPTEEEVTNQINAELDGLFAQAKVLVLYGRANRLATGKKLEEIHTFCVAHKLHYTERVTDELGIPERTARDWRNEYRASLKEAGTNAAADFAGLVAGGGDGDGPKDDPPLPPHALTASCGAAPSPVTQKEQGKEPRKPAMGFNVHFAIPPKELSKEMIEQVKEAPAVLGAAYCAQILIDAMEAKKAQAAAKLATEPEATT